MQLSFLHLPAGSFYNSSTVPPSSSVKFADFSFLQNARTHCCPILKQSIFYFTAILVFWVVVLLKKDPKPSPQTWFSDTWYPISLLKDLVIYSTRGRGDDRTSTTFYCWQFVLFLMGLISLSINKVTVAYQSKRLQTLALTLNYHSRLLQVSLKLFRCVAVAAWRFDAPMTTAVHVLNTWLGIII